MTKYCIFRLYGSMVSFGEMSVGDFRHTLDHPTKSSVFGFIAGALGIKRDDKENDTLSDNYGFSSLVRLRGKIISDYHIAQSPSSKDLNNSVRTRRDELNVSKALNNVVSSRDYICDHFSQICIWAKNDEVPYTLEEIAHSIAHPVFTPYVGRKACVLSLPSCPKIVDADNLFMAYSDKHVALEKDCFVEESILNIMKIDPSKKTYLYWDHDEKSQLTSNDRVQISELNDNLISRSRWQYNRRKECSAMISINPEGVLCIYQD